MWRNSRVFASVSAASPCWHTGHSSGDSSLYFFSIFDNFTLDWNSSLYFFSIFDNFTLDWNSSLYFFSFSHFQVFYFVRKPSQSSPGNLSQSMIRQVDRFSMHIAPGGKGVTNRLPEKTLPVCVCYIAALLHCQCVCYIYWSNGSK